MSSKLNIRPQLTTYGGVADFDDNTITIQPQEVGTGSDDFAGEKVFKWKMWLDNDSGYDNEGFQLDTSSNFTHGLNMFLLDSCIYLLNYLGRGTSY